jgi:hypothetical protein
VSALVHGYVCQHSVEQRSAAQRRGTLFLSHRLIVFVCVRVVACAAALVAANDGVVFAFSLTGTPPPDSSADLSPAAL